jgi:hypothetical protein
MLSVTRFFREGPVKKGSPPRPKGMCRTCIFCSVTFYVESNKKHFLISRQSLKYICPRLVEFHIHCVVTHFIRSIINIMVMNKYYTTLVRVMRLTNVQRTYMHLIIFPLIHTLRTLTGVCYTNNIIHLRNGPLSNRDIHRRVFICVHWNYNL